MASSFVEVRTTAQIMAWDSTGGPLAPPSLSGRCPPPCDACGFLLVPALAVLRRSPGLEFLDGRLVSLRRLPRIVAERFARELLEHRGGALPEVDVVGR